MLTPAHKTAATLWICWNVKWFAAERKKWKTEKNERKLGRRGKNTKRKEKERIKEREIKEKEGNGTSKNKEKNRKENYWKIKEK